MKKVVFKDYDRLSEYAAKFVAEELSQKDNFILGLPTGGTPIGMYANLSKMYGQGKVDFSGVITFNLDEYLGLLPTQPQSYHYFMNEHLYSKVNLKRENINILSGVAFNMNAECIAYDKKIEDMGGIDLMVLGIGPNGHIGFNEPGEYLMAPTHTIDLTEETIQANARFFDCALDVPTKAVTMGVGSIMKAKKILMLISGENKNEVAKALFEGRVRISNPATLLLLHRDVTLLIDEVADYEDFMRWTV